MKKLELCVVKKVFNNEDEIIEYFELSTKLDNENIRLQVKDDDKKLFKYLLKFHKFDDKGGLVD